MKQISTATTIAIYILFFICLFLWFYMPQYRLEATSVLFIVMVYNFFRILFPKKNSDKNIFTVRDISSIKEDGFVKIRGKISSATVLQSTFGKKFCLAHNYEAYNVSKDIISESDGNYGTNEDENTFYSRTFCEPFTIYDKSAEIYVDTKGIDIFESTEDRYDDIKARDDLDSAFVNEYTLDYNRIKEYELSGYAQNQLGKFVITQGSMQELAQTKENEDELFILEASTNNKNSANKSNSNFIIFSTIFIVLFALIPQFYIDGRFYISLGNSFVAHYLEGFSFFDKNLFFVINVPEYFIDIINKIAAANVDTLSLFFIFMTLMVVIFIGGAFIGSFLKIFSRVISDFTGSLFVLFFFTIIYFLFEKATHETLVVSVVIAVILSLIYAIFINIKKVVLKILEKIA